MNPYDELELLGTQLKELQARVAQLELAEAGFKSREEMSKALSIILELLKNPTFVRNAEQQGLKFDAVSIFNAFIDASGWKFEQPVIKNLTRREVIQRAIWNTHTMGSNITIDFVTDAIETALDKAAI